MYIEQPITVKGLQLANRLVLPPMNGHKATGEGHITEENLKYYDAMTRDGAFPLVIVEHCYIMPGGRASVDQISIADDSTLPGLKKLAELLHRNGCKAVVQINHCGGRSNRAAAGEVVAPSLYKVDARDNVDRALEKEELPAIVEAFAAAARRVKQLGFDGVEVHSAHGYLLNEFYSPFANRRSDEYGGDIQGRTRLHREVLTAVRQAVGPDFPLFLRLGALDYMEGGSTAEDAVAAAKLFEEWGVDLLDISGGMGGYVRPGHTEAGFFGDAAAAIRKAVQVPVILTGGVTELAQGEKLLADGLCDLVGVGRAMLKDPEWGKKQWQAFKG